MDKENRSRQKTPGKRKKAGTGRRSGNSIPEKMLADLRAWAAGQLESLQRMDMKRLALLNFPYIVAVYLFDKAAWLYSRCPGDSMVEKAGVLFLNFSMAFDSPFPSMEPRNLFIGVAGAALVKAIVYTKGKNAKKFRHGTEYGSARWGDGRRYQAVY